MIELLPRIDGSFRLISAALSGCDPNRPSSASSGWGWEASASCFHRGTPDRPNAGHLTKLPAQWLFLRGGFEGAGRIRWSGSRLAPSRRHDEEESGCLCRGRCDCNRLFLGSPAWASPLSASSDVAVFWPASGLAAGILIIFGRRARPALVIGVVAGTIAANLLSDRSIATSN